MASLKVSIRVPLDGKQMPRLVPLGAPMQVGSWWGQSAPLAQAVDGYAGEPPEYA
jgi:hypothetical protein